ncbi:MAG: hypothetical protein ACRCSO_06615 [Sphingomonas sp.]
MSFFYKKRLHDKMAQKSPIFTRLSQLLKPEFTIVAVPKWHVRCSSASDRRDHRDRPICRDYGSGGANRSSFGHGLIIGSDPSVRQSSQFARATRG